MGIYGSFVSIPRDPFLKKEKDSYRMRLKIKQDRASGKTALLHSLKTIEEKKVFLYLCKWSKGAYCTQIVKNCSLHKDAVGKALKSLVDQRIVWHDKGRFTIAFSDTGYPKPSNRKI